MVRRLGRVLELQPCAADDLFDELFVHQFAARYLLGDQKQQRSGSYIPITEKNARRRRRPSRRAIAQPERRQRVYGRTISLECLNGYHFCKCPMLNCACVCHDIDREPLEDEGAMC
jgi:hypothetical protein